MKNSEKILKVAHELASARKARIESIVAPLRKKAQAPAQSGFKPGPWGIPVRDYSAAVATQQPAPAASGQPSAAQQSKTPTLKAIGGEVKDLAGVGLGQFRDWGSKNTVGGGAATGAAGGAVLGLVSEFLRRKQKGERSQYLRAMLTHALLGGGIGALVGHYSPKTVSGGLGKIKV